MKLLVLVWLTLQNSVHNVLMRYSRSRPVEHMFLPGTAVLCTESIKVMFCLVIMMVQHRSLATLLRSMQSQVLCKDTLKMGFLALTFILQNNLNYVAASHLHVGVFMITSQLKLFTTVLFAMLILRQRFTRRQWMSVVLLFGGVCLVQAESLHNNNVQTKDSVTPSDKATERPLLGLMAVVAASALSGFGTVYFEKIIKSLSPVSLWVRNIQLSVCAIPLGCVTAAVSHLHELRSGQAFIGFDHIVWCTVTWLAIGGLTVAVAIKYADNISKNFATALAIILSTAASIPIFNVVPSVGFLVGASIVLMATFMYAAAPVYDEYDKLPLQTSRQHEL